MKLISYCLGFSVFFRWSIWVVSENPTGNTDYADDVTQYVAIGEDNACATYSTFWDKILHIW